MRTADDMITFQQYIEASKGNEAENDCNEPHIGKKVRNGEIITCGVSLRETGTTNKCSACLQTQHPKP